MENGIQTLKEQFLNASEIKLLCGAGISLHSGLPTAKMLLMHMFEEAGVTEGFRNVAIQLNIPFEAWMGFYIRYDLSSGVNILRMFSDHRLSPCRNHILIAKLVKRNIVKEIYTTNFDLLIEKALEDTECIRGKEFHVIYDDITYEKYHNSALPSIIKLHGSAEDLNSMCITINSVVQQRNVNFTSQSVTSMVRKEDNKKSLLLVMGYSFSDIFDIRPMLENDTAEHTDIVILQHNSSTNFDDECITKYSEGWLGKIPGKYAITEVNCETDFMVSWLFDIFQLEKPERREIEKINLLFDYINPFFESLKNKIQQHILLADIFTFAGDINSSIKILELYQFQTIDLTSMYTLYSCNLMALGKYQDAIQPSLAWIRAAWITLLVAGIPSISPRKYMETVFATDISPEEITDILETILSSYTEKNHVPDSYLGSFYESVRCFSVCLYEIGETNRPLNLLNKIEKLINYSIENKSYRDVLYARIMQEKGNIFGRIQDYDECYKCFQASLLIKEKYGLAQEIANTLISYAGALFNNGRKSEGITKAKEAHELNNKLNDHYRRLESLHALMNMILIEVDTTDENDNLICSCINELVDIAYYTGFPTWFEEKLLFDFVNFLIYRPWKFEKIFMQLMNAMNGSLSEVTLSKFEIMKRNASDQAKICVEYENWDLYYEFFNLGALLSYPLNLLKRKL